MDMNKETKEHASSDSLLQWGQWQLLDSLLPTGGFAHSLGLEAASQAQMVSVPEDLQTFKHDKMLDAMLTNEVGRKASIAQGSALMGVTAAVYSEIPSLKSVRETSQQGRIWSDPLVRLFCNIILLLYLQSYTESMEGPSS